MATFKTGDRVEVDESIGLYTGKATIVRRLDGDMTGREAYLVNTDEPHLGSREDDYLWVTIDDLTLIDETKTKEVDSMFKVGDKVKVKELDQPMRGFNVGDVVTVGGFISGHVIVTKPGNSVKLTGYSEAKFLEPVVIEVGDKVRLKSSYEGALAGFDDGDIVTVYEADRGKPNDLEVGFPGRMLRGFTKSYNVELVERTPKAEAIPQAKFKVGDYVKGTSEERYVLTNTNMTKGVVIDVDDEEIEVKILEAKPNTQTARYIGHSYHVDPTYFELAGKFKVGDIVRGLPASNLKYSVTNENMTKGEVINVDEDGLEIKVIENIDGGFGKGRTYRGLDPEVFELVTDDEVEVAEAPKQGKRYIRMLNSSIGFKQGDVLELAEDGRYFIDNDGDQRLAHSHKFEEIEGPVSFIEKPITREDVVGYLSDLSAEDLLDIVEDARK